MITILTDFISHDPAYSLCGVVANQVKMLIGLEQKVKVLVRPGFLDIHAYPGAQIQVIDPGEPGDNTVRVGVHSAEEIDSLTAQLLDALGDTTVCLTHDLLYQPNLWKYHVATRRVTKQLPNLRWLHWIHSTTPLNTAEKTAQFQWELNGRFPNSRMVAFHREEINRKGAMYGYEADQVVVIPSPIDFGENWHELTKQLTADLWDCDAVAVYPCRLDRGKQPHITLEIFAQLAKMGYRAHVVIVDFHSTGDDKRDYRNEMREFAYHQGIPVTFTSDHAPYAVPHQVVMELFEFGDIFIHPSTNEADGLVLMEAAWKRCGLVLNFDLPRFREFDGLAVMGKFSSHIDTHTGMPGETNTNYGNRASYMKQLAGAVAYNLRHNPVLQMHTKMRKERSLTAVSRLLWEAIESHD